jgi:hypothetical protein
MNPWAGVQFRPPLSATQLAAIAYNKTHASHSSGGIMGLIHGGEGFLGKALDIISRPANAMAMMGSAELKSDNNNFWSFGSPAAAAHGFMQGLEGKGHKNFAQDFEQAHVLDGHSYIRDALGLSMDIAGDPLNLVGGAGVYGHAGEETAKGFALLRGLNKIDKAGPEGAQAVARMADLNGGVAGRTWLEHSAMITSKGLKDQPYSKTVAEQMAADVRDNTALESLARSQAKANMSKYLGIRLGIGPGSVTLRTPIKIGRTLSERQAALEAGKIPTKIAAGLANSFKPGYLNPIGHAMGLYTRHTAEDLTRTASSAIKTALKPFLKGEKAMSVHDMQEALIAAQTKGTVHKGELVHDVLDKALEKRGITGKAAEKAREFVNVYHNIGQHLKRLDKLNGVEYKHGAIEDHVYVPRTFEHGKSFERIMYAKSTLSKAGYAEHTQTMPYEVQLQLAKEGGKGRKIIQDPVELMLHRAQKGSVQGAHGILRQTIRDTLARPTIEHNMGNYAKAFGKVNKMKAERDAAQKIIDSHAGRVTRGRLMAGQKRAQFQASLDHAVSENENKIKTLTASLKGTKGRARGTLQASLNAAKREKVALQKIVTEAPHQARYTQDVTDAGVAAAKTTAQAQKAVDKIGKKLITAEPAAAKAMWEKNPHALEDGWKKIDSLSVKGGPNGSQIHYTLPEEVHAGIANIEKAMVDPARMNSLEKSFGKAIATWKLSVTSVNPGYRIRNSISDLWNMYLSGVPIHAIPIYAAKAATETRLARKGERKLQRLAALTAEQGKLKRPLTLDEFRKLWLFHGTNAEAGAAITKDAVLTPSPIGVHLTNNLEGVAHVYAKREGEGAVAMVHADDLKKAGGTTNGELAHSMNPVPVRAVVKPGAEEKAMRKEYQRYRNSGPAALTLTKREKEAMTLIRTAHSQGVMSGQFEGDVSKGVSHLRNGDKNPLTRYARTMTDANATAENVGRLTHYMYRLDHGYSQGAAADIVRAAHFDYEDLSSFEQRWMKNIAPFYTWTRKNVPYQLQQLAEHPGRVATYGKVANTSEQMSGAKPSDVIGHGLDYHPLGFRLGAGYVDPQVGLSDLYNAFNKPSNELNLVNPALQDAITVLTGKSFGTGQDLTGPNAAHQAIPAPGILSALLSPLGLGETTQRPVNGVAKYGPGVNPWVGQVAGQIPFGSFLMSRNPIDEARKGSTPIPGVDPRTLSYLGGLSYTNIDKQQQLAIASMETAAADKAYVKHLRDQGLMTPSDWKPGNSWFDNYLKKYNKHKTTAG